MSRNKTTRPLPADSNHQVEPEPAKYTTKSGIKKAVRIIPRSSHQEEYLEHLLNPDKIIVLAHGCAGSGKTHLALLSAIKAFSEKKIDKIILCRPSVGVDDEDLGYLPGDINDKMLPWMQPFIDVLLEYYSAKDIFAMTENKVIEFLPLMNMRGRNIKHAYVLLDEAQNTSISQCKTVFTRLCENSKLIVTGDNDQSDRNSSENGLLFFKNALHKFGGSSYIGSVEFTQADIQRHPIVDEVLNIFKLSGK
jgi:phosphate starvation-inducible PhoH-like protein